MRLHFHGMVRLMKRVVRARTCLSKITIVNSTSSIGQWIRRSAGALVILPVYVGRTASKWQQIPAALYSFRNHLKITATVSLPPQVQRGSRTAQNLEV